jgi:hypothetical protein
VDAAAISFAARLVVAGVLVFAAVAKVRAPSVTRAQTVALVGDALGPGLAVAVPVVEIAIAVMLIAWWSAVPALLAACLLGAFTIVVVRAQLRGLPCPCFGAPSSDATAGPPAILRNALLVAYAVLGTASPAGARPWAVVVAVGLLGLPAGVVVWLAGRQRAVNRRN